AIGMTVNRFAPRFAAKFERNARIISSILFVLVIAGAVYSERENIVDYFRQAGPATLMLNLIMMALAYSLAKAARLGSRQQIAITLECGLQNGTLAIFVAATFGMAGFG
ncbi:MAG: bile acid:sodium symporter family protein, partial [Acidobacteria bacterium]|nr:bile acid:sodium symporter family protein [Acidobacteriota bacterium]